jgi:thiol-disulfide isomerase/thioredoxin
MKNAFVIVISMFLFMACAEKKANSTDLAEKTSEATIEQKSDIVEVSKIPSYDFDEIEREYLLKNDGITYILNFWATWCKPCVKELPAFEKLNSEYKDKNVKVVLVSLDFPEKLVSGVIPFVEKYGLKSQVILLDDDDANGWIPRVSKEWSGAIPATLIVKNGTVKFYERSFTFEELEKELKTIL